MQSRLALHWFDFIELGNGSERSLAINQKRVQNLCHLCVQNSILASIASYVIILLSTFDYY